MKLKKIYLIILLLPFLSHCAQFNQEDKTSTVRNPSSTDKERPPSDPVQTNNSDENIWPQKKKAKDHSFH